ncbi:hypothetical protein [Flagellimonas nanhaiensis]|nr:hypothetical protein [Allomuricauda nanhaiensis]
MNEVKTFFSPLRENVFLHLNKTTFIKGENIWFAAYVYDQNEELPSVSTSNLHVALYNSKGQEVKKEIIYVEHGIGHGQFLIDENFTDSSYYIKAWTNWMNNFEEVKAYWQRIEILNSGSRLNAMNTEPTIDYTPLVDVFPEGGKIISSANNVIGFQIKNAFSKTNPVESIALLDDQGGVKDNGISFDAYGYGKFNMYIEHSKEYQLRVTFKNGNEIFKTLPQATEEGINVNVASISSSYINLAVNTNPATLEKERGNVQFLLFKKNTRSFVKELILDSTSTIIKIPKKSLYGGLNSITLFNSDLIPQSERLVFNDHGLVGGGKELKVGYEYNGTKDSVVLSVALNNKADSLAHLSVSVLPARSIAYRPRQNIVSSMLVEPYIKNAFRGVGRNLELNNRQSLLNTELQLLLNGGGSYPWKLIETGEWEETFNIENGIGLSGKILDADLGNEEQIWFYTKEMGNAFYTLLEEDKSFSVNQILYEGDSLFISVFDKKGKLRKPKVEVNLDMGNTENAVQIPKQEFVSEFYPELDPTETGMSLLEPETINLDEVVLEGRRNRIGGSYLGYANHQVTKEDANRYGSLTIYLRRLGFRVSVENSRLVVASNRFPHPVLPIFVDGMYSNGTELIDWPLSLVSRISYDSNSPKAISITLNRQSRAKEKKYEVLPIAHGYAFSTPYEAPNYLSIKDEVFQLLGAIHWEPNLTLRADLESHISFHSFEQEQFIIHFEGIDSNGKLISQKEFISLRQN